MNSTFLRRENLGLVIFSLALLILPLTAMKPGMPVTFKADEPAYYLAAESLVRDFDLRVETKDLERIFQSFPYLQADNVIVASEDGWRTLYFGKPYLYSFFAAPFVGLWGVNGMVAFNMLMLVAMIWMGALWLRRFNESPLADFFAVGFYVLGLPFIYVFWMHPEIFNMFGAAACLYFAFATDDDRPSTYRALALSAACLGLGVYNKPMLAAVGLPVCFELLRKREWRRLGVWLAAAVLSMGLYVAGSWALTGKATAYLVDLRAGFPVQDPGAVLVEPLPEPDPATVQKEVGGETVTLVTGDDEDRKSAGWWWILKKPHVKSFELAEDVPLFFFGRHVGLFTHQPFALLGLLLFLVHGLRSLRGWTILVSGLLVAAFFQATIPFNWHGGGGFVGNRYFVMACPVFLYIVTKIRPGASLVAAAAMAGLLMGPLVLSPYGLAVPRPTLQAHARNPPFDLLPMELGIKWLPGHHGTVQEGIWLFGRKDHIQPIRNGGLQIAAGERVDLWLQSSRPLRRIELQMVSNGLPTDAVLTLGNERREVRLGETPADLVFEPQEPTGVRRERRRLNYFEFMDIWDYRLEIEIERGMMPAWQNRAGTRLLIGGVLQITATDPPPPEEISEKPVDGRAEGSAVSE